MIPRMTTRLGCCHETMRIVSECSIATVSPSASGATQQDKVDDDEEEEENEDGEGVEEEEGTLSFKDENAIYIHHDPVVQS